MTRPLRLFPLLLCLLLAGCNTAAAVGERPIAVGFSCTAQGTYHGDEVAGKIERSSAGLLSFTLTKPDELNGLTMTWDGQTVTLGMLGLEWSLSPEKVPSAALGKRLLQALDAVVYTTTEGVLTDDGRRKTTGEAEKGVTYTLYSDPKTGALLSLEVPAEELQLTFEDFTKI
ncbi:MAG: hypothetical protein E7549_08515 [Ruminococcaceae bacterium]|nr:hypothetical protein [Oscillospiraceae bacterium]